MLVFSCRSQSRVVPIKNAKPHKPSSKKGRAAQPHPPTQQGPQTCLHRQADQTFPDSPPGRVSMAHLFTVSRNPQSPNRVSVGSDQTTFSSRSGSSRITNVSMENQVSREGSVSPRRISSEGSRSPGERLELQDCVDNDGDEELDPLGNFPLTRPGNPVRANGSIWTWR